MALCLAFRCCVYASVFMCACILLNNKKVGIMTLFWDLRHIPPHERCRAIEHRTIGRCCRENSRQTLRDTSWRQSIGHATCYLKGIRRTDAFRAKGHTRVAACSGVSRLRLGVRQVYFFPHMLDTKIRKYFDKTCAFRVRKSHRRIDPSLKDHAGCVNSLVTLCWDVEKGRSWQTYVEAERNVSFLGFILSEVTLHHKWLQGIMEIGTW